MSRADHVISFDPKGFPKSLLTGNRYCVPGIFYVVIELKAVAFKPEYAGKLNFYLSALDATLKHENDNPSIGLILCKDKNRLIAEYVLKDISKPVGVSEYRLIESIPEDMQGSLPSIEQIEAELSSEAEGV